jgi:hypothetical protein
MTAAKRRRTLTQAKPGGEHGDRHGGGRGSGFCAVGRAAAKLATPILKQRGGGMLVRLKADWPAIAGPQWAPAAWPFALGRDGALKLRTAPAAALELQHRAPLLIERINLYFGRPAVARLVLLQAGLPHTPGPAAPAAAPSTAGEAAALDSKLGGIADPALRAALARLGRAVAGAGTRG